MVALSSHIHVLLFFHRYVLDHPWLVRGRRVLDLGSGCGACAVAAALGGASRAAANDVDPAALVAATVNAEEENGVCGVDTIADDLLMG